MSLKMPKLVRCDPRLWYDYIQLDRRSCHRMRKIFDKGGKKFRKTRNTKKKLQQAKKEVIAEIRRQRRLSKTPQGCELEKAFYIVTGEPHLLFDYDLMIQMVEGAKLGTAKEFKKEKDVCAVMDLDDFFVIVNKSMKMSSFDMRVALMHECLHGTVERRGRRVNPFLSGEIEHRAMAILGDEDEFNDLNYKSVKTLRKFTCKKRVKEAGLIMSSKWWKDKTKGISVRGTKWL